MPKVAQYLLAVSPSLVAIWLVMQSAVKSAQQSARTVSPGQVYWRFISGFGPIGSNLGHLAQIGQYRQMAQSRINTGDCAYR